MASMEWNVQFTGKKPQTMRIVSIHVGNLTAG